MAKKQKSLTRVGKVYGKNGRIPVGRTKFYEDYVATGRLTLIPLGLRAKAVDDDEIDRVRGALALLSSQETMTTEKIYEDASRPATLHNGAVSTDCPTLQEAVVAWHRLRPEQAQKATIRVIGGPLYTAAEIPRLHYGPKSA